MSEIKVRGFYSLQSNLHDAISMRNPVTLVNLEFLCMLHQMI